MKSAALTRKTPMKRTSFTPSTHKVDIKSGAKKYRKCTICKEAPVANPMASVCSVGCAIVKANKDREQRDMQARRVARAEDRKRKEEMKTRSDWLKEAQTAFNAFIRERDRQAGHLCISSGKPLDWSGNGVDAGHYRSVGSAPHLRFDERNCHAQSKQDNRYGAGRAVDYRIGLIKRIGLEAVEALESEQAPQKWTIDALKAIKATYKAKLKALKQGDA
ncbi:MAG TPA: recombination protein NinG [Noviherbaspirillum sp.]|jgi:hypothetical protein|uniref:recombination protein NinG n=1 Tax=Noviherbaspirillum sp. TaxID=1926288 RepID=UPI002DDCDD62|nr:recombination protein NinG [Noviherbaspirillum sp.]HEV2612519.1 recombination protein NinG [Noviherbaspirillum sp.]